MWFVLKGCLDWAFYEEMPNVDAGGPVHDGETAADETQFVEKARMRGFGYVRGKGRTGYRCH